MRGYRQHTFIILDKIFNSYANGFSYNCALNKKKNKCSYFSIKTVGFYYKYNLYRYALTYILLISISWLAYFVILGIENNSIFWPYIAVMFAAVGAMVSAILYLTHTDHYRSIVLPISVGVALMLCCLSIAFLVYVPPYTDGLTLVSVKLSF